MKSPATRKSKTDNKNKGDAEAGDEETGDVEASNERTSVMK